MLMTTTRAKMKIFSSSSSSKNHLHIFPIQLSRMNIDRTSNRTTYISNRICLAHWIEEEEEINIPIRFIYRCSWTLTVYEKTCQCDYDYIDWVKGFACYCLESTIISHQTILSDVSIMSMWENNCLQIFERKLVVLINH